MGNKRGEGGEVEEEENRDAIECVNHLRQEVRKFTVNGKV